MKTSLDVLVEVEIERNRLAVWTVVSDVERLPEWLDEFQAARKESDGPTGLGTVVQYTVGENRTGAFEIVEWDPPRKWAWDGPPRPRGSLTLAEAGADGTRVSAP